jgi:dipeptidase D
MDMISFGPTITGAHSPDERVEISTVEQFWDFLVALLGSMEGGD